MTEIQAEKPTASLTEWVIIPLGPPTTPWLAVFSEICQKARHFANEAVILATGRPGNE